MEGNLPLGRGILLEKRGGEQEERVYPWALWSPLMMHLGVSTVMAVKGWWVPECHLAHAQAGWSTVSRQSESKELVLCYCPLNTLLPTETVFAFIPQLTLLQPQLRKSSSKSCVLNSMENHCGLGSFLPFQMLLGMHSFKC